jgi:hypothetical protein
MAKTSVLRQLGESEMVGGPLLSTLHHTKGFVLRPGETLRGLDPTAYSNTSSRWTLDTTPDHSTGIKQFDSIDTHHEQNN